MANKVFAEGLILKTITTKFGELDKMSIKTDEFKEFLDKYDNNGWVNLDIKIGQTSGKKYAELDTWKADADNKPSKKTESGDDDLSSIPF